MNDPSQTIPSRLPISAVVVCRNEEDLLERCLRSLAFCTEIILIDLESADNSREVAKPFATRILSHPKVNAVEKLFSWVSPMAANDWILLIDPDEVVDPSLSASIAKLFTGGDDRELNEIGLISLPWQFYFKGTRLTGTVWGGDVVRKQVLFHRGRVRITEQVHTRPQPVDGYHALDIPRINDNCIHHYWAYSYRSLATKFRRHAKEEARTKMGNGCIYTVRGQIRAALGNFLHSYKRRDGWRMGLMGFTLSLMFGWYQYMCWAYLREALKTEPERNYS